jgi:two-component system nitrogen regulation response regulator NtrX
VETFLEEFAIQNRDRRKKITPAALEILGKYTWPGNVRELKNLVERMVILVDSDAIDVHNIPDTYNLDPNSANELIEYELFNCETFKEAKLAFEQAFINRKLMQHGNNVTKTAESMGVGRSFLHKKIKSFKSGKLR